MITPEFIDKFDGIVSSGQNLHELQYSKWHKAQLAELLSQLTEQKDQQEFWELLQQWSTATDGWYVNDLRWLAELLHIEHPIARLEWKTMEKVYIYTHICCRGRQSIHQYEVDRKLFEKLLETLVKLPRVDRSEKEQEEINNLLNDDGLADVYVACAIYKDYAPFLKQWNERQKMYAAGEEVTVGCGLSALESKLAYVDGQFEEIMSSRKE
jgi:hypothetical protein